MIGRITAVAAAAASGEQEFGQAGSEVQADYE